MVKVNKQWLLSTDIFGTNHSSDKGTFTSIYHKLTKEIIQNVTAKKGAIWVSIDENNSKSFEDIKKTKKKDRVAIHVSF